MSFSPALSHPLLSRVGYYSGAEDYYTHKRTHSVAKIKMKGYDFHRDVLDNLTTAWEYKGQYSTFVFTQEVQKLLRQHKPTDKVIITLTFFHDPFNMPKQ